MRERNIVMKSYLGEGNLAFEGSCYKQVLLFGHLVKVTPLIMNLPVALRCFNLLENGSTSKSVRLLVLYRHKVLTVRPGPRLQHSQRKLQSQKKTTGQCRLLRMMLLAAASSKDRAHK